MKKSPSSDTSDDLFIPSIHEPEDDGARGHFDPDGSSHRDLEEDDTDTAGSDGNTVAEGRAQVVGLTNLSEGRNEEDLSDGEAATARSDSTL